jgi:hypothetical protein
MNLPEPLSLNFSTIMSDIEKGYTKIPQFQRDFVWNREKSGKLLDSIVKAYPIGTLIFWRTKEELRAIRNLGGLALPETPEGDFINYVLDGQQRLTSLFSSLKGLKIQREDYEEDFSQFYIDLEAKEDEPIVITELADTNSHQRIKLNDLLYGKLKLLASYPENLQEKIQFYKDRINAYQFSAILVKEAPIDVATEIFTRLNVTGKPLSVFEIMVAKTFDAKRDFDLAEKFDELITDLQTVDYETLPDSTVLQTVSILIVKECQKRHILKLGRDQIIEIWPEALDAIKRAVDYFRDYYRIPVSRLLPYPSLLVPFSYFFHKHKDKPTGKTQKYLQDFFWRVSLGGRYSQSLEARLAQDIKKIDTILEGKLPKYEWAVDTSAKFIQDNGWFSLSRSYIRALLCILAYQEPKSFIDNAIVRINNDWLKQANSKNYHHFFPKAVLAKEKVTDFYVNHIANITIVDDFLNKREIRAKPPSIYMKKFAKMNKEIDTCMKTHLIRLNSFGVFDDGYIKFLRKRCQAFSRELRKRIIEQEIDRKEHAVGAEQTIEAELI